MLSVVRPYLGKVISSEAIFRKMLSVVRPYLYVIRGHKENLSVVRPYLGKGYQ